MSDELPGGWAQTTLGALLQRGVFADGDWVESKDQDPAGDVRLIQLADVGDGRFRDRSARFLTSSKAAELDCTFLEPGDVLIARMPEPLGRACVFPGASKRCVTVVDVCIARPQSLSADARWLMHAINAPQFRAQMEEFERGTTRKRISRGNLSLLPLRVPPLMEQRRIAAKVDALLARVNAARERLEKVPLILKQFRKAVLAKAFRGELVPTEAELAAREGRPFQSVTDLLGQGREDAGDELPQGWASTKFGALLRELRNGVSPRPAIEPPGVPVLRISAVRPGLVSLDDVRYLPRGDEHLATFGLRDGDLLFTRYNGSLDLVGVCGLVRGLNGRPRLYPDKLMRVRLRDGVVLPEYVEQFFQSPQARDAVTAIAKSSAGQQGISGGDLKEQLVPIPPVPEQRRIVARVAELLAAAARVEAEAERQLRVVDRAPPAILQRAFAGELVPTESEIAAAQGRQFETAEEMLRRLSSESVGPDSAPGLSGARRLASEQPDTPGGDTSLRRGDGRRSKLDPAVHRVARNSGST